MAIKSDALIAKLHHLHPLSSEEEDILQGAFSAVIEVPADHDLVREGDHPTHCSLLMDGFIFRYKILADGKRQILSFQFPGDIFDTQSFLLDTMDHSVGTLTPCRVALISHTVMREITERFPRIARAMWKETLADAALFRQWLTSAGRRTAYQRIAHLMCESYARQKAVDLTRGQSIQWPVTQSEIGDALGLTHIHINRTLQELRRDGLIKLQSGWLDILDWGGLVEASQFDPSYLQLRDVPLP